MVKETKDLDWFLKAYQALLVEIWWNSRDSTPSYDELVLVIPFAWLRWQITIEIAFVMTDENKNEFYGEIWWISQEGTAGALYNMIRKWSGSGLVLKLTMNSHNY